MFFALHKRLKNYMKFHYQDACAWLWLKMVHVGLLLPELCTAGHSWGGHAPGFWFITESFPSNGRLLSTAGWAARLRLQHPARLPGILHLRWWPGGRQNRGRTDLRLKAVPNSECKWRLGFFLIVLCHEECLCELVQEDLKADATEKEVYLNHDYPNKTLY